MTIGRKLSAQECEQIIAYVEQLEVEATRSPMEAEKVLGSILKPLLASEGFDLGEQNRPGERDYGVDFRASRDVPATGAVDTVAVVAKFWRNQRTVPASELNKLIGAALSQNFGRVILVSNTPFSKSALEMLEHNLPLAVELKTLKDLRSWIELAREEQPDSGAEVRIILQAVSERLARLIAQDPGTLAHLEWRDVERTIAEIFDGLGFKVTLTPGSKDGGKDVILECEVAGMQATYYVEIKHWRSSTRVGADAVEKLLKVIVREKKAGGLFLSTYGFTENAFEQLTTIDRQKLRFGDQDRIVTLCRTYVKAKAGIWSPPKNLTEVLFDD